LSSVPWTRLQNQGVQLLKIEKDEEIKRKKLAAYQEEMKDFTAFLKEKYFSPF